MHIIPPPQYEIQGNFCLMDDIDVHIGQNLRWKPEELYFNGESIISLSGGVEK